MDGLCAMVGKVGGGGQIVTNKCLKESLANLGLELHLCIDDNRR